MLLTLAEGLAILEKHAQLARERGDIHFAESLEVDAAGIRREMETSAGDAPLEPSAEASPDLQRDLDEATAAYAAAKAAHQEAMERLRRAKEAFEMAEARYKRPARLALVRERVARRVKRLAAEGEPTQTR